MGHMLQYVHKCKLAYVRECQARTYQQLKNIIDLGHLESCINDAENAEFLASSRLWMVDYFCDSYLEFLKHSQVHVSTVHTVWQ